MYSEIEGQKPVVVSRNHNARIRPALYRWTMPPDWNPVWNRQRSYITGAFSGLVSALYLHAYEPARDILRFYQGPENLTQLKTFVSELVKMENFRQGFLGKLGFYSLYGLSYEASRFYMWHDYAAGFPHEKSSIDVTWPKKFFTSITVGLLTSWIPVPFHNVMMRYRQDQILPTEFKRGYRSPLHAAYTIARKDGLFPFVRSAGPIMAEHTASTFGLFFFLDFFKDKARHLRNFGGDFDQYSDTFLKFVCVSLGTYLSLFHAYPFRSLRLWVEELPTNANGEVLFRNYAEAFWKVMSDDVNMTQLWNGFHRYLARAGPPLFATIWVADGFGLTPVSTFPTIWVAED
jgi:hypothetical protein